MIKKYILFFALFLTLLSCTNTGQITLTSPDGTISVDIINQEMLSYSVTMDQNMIIDQSTLGFSFQNAPPIGKFLKILNIETYQVDKNWEPVLKRYAVIRNQYKGMVIELQEMKYPARKINIEVRAYNDGIAFRTVFLPADTSFRWTIMEEETRFRFSEDLECWAVDYKEFDTHQESEFTKMSLSDVTKNMLIGLPLTIQFSENIYGAITEAALIDYSGMYLVADEASKGQVLRSQLAPRHNKDREGEKVIFSGVHKTPWRVIMLGRTAGELVESEIIQNLNAACKIQDPSWIKPGISAWDHWWSGEVRMEQDVIYEYIDLASEMGWEYMLIDWQWYGQFDRSEANIMKPAPQLNMSEILQYAGQKDIRCWLWLYWTDVERADFNEACKLYRDWGIAGVKIDFMARDDQEMVNWYHEVVKTAARHQLMVDFHGAYKPTGWRRTFPNLMTREGVLGNEYTKWSYRVTPDHNCTLPFTRMLAGPMDYTPGGFLNCTAEQFITGTPARVQGTRSHTLAQFVIYDSPYLVACDHPENYHNQSGRGFLMEVPSVWDDTKVLNGEIGKYITMARRSGERWFLASMTNSDAREIAIDLNFLVPGKKYELVGYSDSEKSWMEGQEIDKIKEEVEFGDIIQIKMAPGGGYAAFLVPE